MKILVSGANGFVGRRLCLVLSEAGHEVRAAVRTATMNHFCKDVVLLPVGDIGPSTDWTAFLQGIDVIIHLAARVHVMKESSKDPLAEYRRINVEGTRRLALAAVQAGVRRIIYLSTIKVNGESTCEKPFSEDDVPSPHDDYSISKREAEEALREISLKTGLEVVIMRPPLVYGPGVKGNLLRLMHYINRDYPLPFGGIHNSRSLISLDNLVDVLLLSAVRFEAAGQTFMVSDGEDISTPDLIKKIAAAMGKEPKLINFPNKIFSFAAAVVPALKPVASRLTGSLVIDSTKFRNMFHWIPPQTISDGIKSMVSDFLQHQTKNCAD